VTAPENALQAIAAQDTSDHYAGYDYDGVTHIRTEMLDHARWHVLYLDIYLHLGTGTCAGLLWRRGATESQDSEPPEVVAVEEDPTPHFRIKRTR